jgi:N-acetylglutamate synthase-like GNAT family acetyltransferase
MKFVVVPFQDLHREQVVRLVLDIQNIEFSLPITLEQQPDLADVPTFFRKGKGDFRVALVGEEVVGTVGIVDFSADQCVLRKMFVKKEFRGSDKGIAQSLLDRVKDECRLRGLREIFLGTIPTTHAAVRFYLKNGFAEIPSEELPAKFPRMSVDTRVYWLRL